jgi:hypothetical protein
MRNMQRINVADYENIAINEPFIEIQHRQFAGWYKNEFSKNMDSNVTFRLSYSNEKELEQIMIRDWNRIVTPDEAAFHLSSGQHLLDSGNGDAPRKSICNFW